MDRTLLQLHVPIPYHPFNGHDAIAMAAAALQGGATTIQLRDKRASTEELIATGRQLLALTRAYGALLIINDRPELVPVIDADGVHIGQEDGSGEEARRIIGPHRILGISAGNPDEAARAIAAGADYVSIGPIFATGSKHDAGPPIGTTLLSILAKQAKLPLVAIGGITLEYAAEPIRSGACGIACISAILGSNDIAAATKAFRTAIVQALPTPANTYHKVEQ